MNTLTSNREKILVLDSSFFFVTQQIPENLDSALFTTPEILSEILDPLNKIRIDYLIDSKKLIVREGSEEKKSFLFKKMKKFSNLDKLSSPDQSLLILALTLQADMQTKHVVIITDDYEIQNVAKLLKIDYQPIRAKGIKFAKKTVLKCKACHHNIDKNDIECQNCGNKTFYHKRS